MNLDLFRETTGACFRTTTSWQPSQHAVPGSPAIARQRQLPSCNSVFEAGKAHELHLLSSLLSGVQQAYSNRADEGWIVTAPWCWSYYENNIKLPSVSSAQVSIPAKAERSCEVVAWCRRSTRPALFSRNCPQTRTSFWNMISLGGAMADGVVHMRHPIAKFPSTAVSAGYRLQPASPPSEAVRPPESGSCPKTLSGLHPASLVMFGGACA